MVDICGPVTISPLGPGQGGVVGQLALQPGQDLPGEGGVAGVPVVGRCGVEGPGRVGVAIGPGPEQRVGVETAALLAAGDQGEPVTSIGRTVGWPDQSMFARRFKAHYGLSATTYRKRFATRSAHLHYPADPVATAS